VHTTPQHRRTFCLFHFVRHPPTWYNCTMVLAVCCTASQAAQIVWWGGGAQETPLKRTRTSPKQLAHAVHGFTVFMLLGLAHSASENDQYKLVFSIVLISSSGNRVPWYHGTSVLWYSPTRDDLSQRITWGRKFGVLLHQMLHSDEHMSHLP
jgi:hypothetical protein